MDLACHSCCWVFQSPQKHELPGVLGFNPNPQTASRRGMNCQTNFDPAQYKLEGSEVVINTDGTKAGSIAEVAAAIAAAGAGPPAATGGARGPGHNSRSSSLYRGVRWHERNNKWEARIFDGVKQRSLGETEIAVPRPHIAMHCRTPRPWNLCCYLAQLLWLTILLEFRNAFAPPSNEFGEFSLLTPSHDVFFIPQAISRMRSTRLGPMIWRPSASRGPTPRPTSRTPTM